MPERGRTQTSFNTNRVFKFDRTLLFSPAQLLCLQQECPTSLQSKRLSKLAVGELKQVTSNCIAYFLPQILSERLFPEVFLK